MARSAGESGVTGGLGLPAVLTIVFVVLKLTEVIDWSWWWVLSPLWISAGLFVLLTLILGTVWLIAKGGRRDGRYGP